MTIALIDIHLFNRINDGHRHQAGDTVLKAFAAASTDVLRAADVLARWGNEEFLLMLPATHPEQAQHSVERLRSSAGANPARRHCAGLERHVLGRPERLHRRRLDRRLHRARRPGHVPRQDAGPRLQRAGLTASPRRAGTPRCAPRGRAVPLHASGQSSRPMHRSEIFFSC